MDITTFYPFVKRNGYSLTISMVYIIARASNAIPEFRQRIRGEQVVEHEIVNPGFSILIDEDLFGFCDVEYTENFAEFSMMANKNIAVLKANGDLLRNTENDDVYEPYSLGIIHKF
jgi:chloramphenicol O-acetyltransferase type A